MQHPRAIGGGMDDNPKDSASSTDSPNDRGTSHPLPQSELTARYRWVYDDLCHYCNDMWASIAAMRNCALEQALFSGSFLGLYLAFDATSGGYRIGWWGFSSIVMLIMVTIPLLRLVVGIVKSTEYRMTTDRIKEPNWELPEQIIATKEKEASILQENSEKTAKSYILARRYWLLGVAMCAALGVIEWFV